MDTSEYLKDIGTFDQLSEISQLKILQCVLSSGISMCMTAYGQSMLPFICNGDRVTIAPFGSKSLSIGDIVAAERPGTKSLVIHRLVNENNGSYLIKGDNCVHSDGEVLPKHIVGMVVDITRNSKSANFGIGKAGKWIAWLSQRNLLSLIRMGVHFPIRVKNRIIRFFHIGRND